MKTTYAGLDYARGTATNRDAVTGIRYGVISQYSVNPDAIEDIYSHGEDLSYKEAHAEAMREARTEWENAGNSAEDFDEDSASQDFADGYESDNGLNDYLYERDGYKLTGCLSNDLFVIRSPFFTVAQFCSPCVPGAGNLDSPFESVNNQEGLDGVDYLNEAESAGFPRVYCLGHDWFESNMAPYAVYSVETGKLVMP